MRRTRTRVTVLGSAIMVILAANIAFAAWTASGTGSGTATAVSAQALTTTAAATTADLYPGSTGAVKVTVNNPNDYAVQISSITGDGDITSDKGAACNASTGVTFTDQSSLTQVIAANDSHTFTFATAAAMSNASDNTCQGAVFTIPVSISGASHVPS